jgi:selenium-binding protein 1
VSTAVAVIDTQNDIAVPVYPDGVGAWMAKLDSDLSAGGPVADTRFFPHGNEFRGLREHQTRLQGGDASSDSYCYTS